MKRNIKKLLIAFVILLLGYFNFYAWEKYTHIALTIKSIENSEKIKNNLFNKLNIDQGNYALLKWGNDSKNIYGWIEYGADVEDKTVLFEAVWSRSNNHFHNPLKTFNEAGLTDFSIPFPRLPLSSILWAQNGTEQDYYPEWLGLERDNSWAKVREYYYSALTTPEKISREENFARMFKGLGHQIHLIQDSSVPDHVRNDSHWEKKVLGEKKYGSFRCIETWLEDDNNLHLIVPFSQTPLFPQVNFDRLGENNLVPIFHLIDYNVYNGTNPSNNMEQGLSEYTNANFVSESTILTEGNDPDSLHYFPYPKYSSTNLSSLSMPYIVTATDGKLDYLTYLKKDKHGEIIEHFLKAGYMERALRPNADQPPTEIYLRTLFLDELCHKDYASMLVPRAVGYSAALIDYFFRGEMEVTLPVSNAGIPQPHMEGIYSLCMDPAKGFNRISLMVKNITRDNEEMKNGQVSLVISYRTCNGDPFVPNPPFPEVERKYITVAYPGLVDIPRDSPLRLNFNFSDTPLPATAVDVTITVVFKGDLGAELTDAVAVGFKDISEPTPIDLFNSSDRVCFNNGYVDYDDPALWVAVDINPKNGEIDCLNNAEIDITRKRIKPIYLSFNGQPAISTNYYFKYENGAEILPGETPFRFYVLADAYPAKLNYSVLVHAQSIDNPNDCLCAYSNAVDSVNPYTNKLVWNGSLEPDQRRYEHIHSPIGYFRGFPYWILDYFDNNTVPIDSSCSASASVAASSSSESSNKKSLGAPQINAVRPVKESE
jgi:hypothetical protein